jgi:uncharacterized protein YjbI with pentapeptide repeats
LAAVALLAGACADQDNGLNVSGAEFAKQAAALEVQNGDEINGTAFNGIMFNGVMFNGVMFNGVMFNGVMFNGVMFNGVMFNGTRSTDGVAVSGTDIMNSGTRMKGKLSNNSDIDLRIDGITHDNTYNVDWYNVSMSIDGGVNWGPLCAGGVGAMPVNNRWDSLTGGHLRPHHVHLGLRQRGARQV